MLTVAQLIGCGRAIDATELSKSGARIIGLEPSVVMMARAQKCIYEDGVGVRLTRGVGERLPFKSQSFDKIVCKGALDHFYSPIVALEEISRVLRPDGEAIIALANFDSLGFYLGEKINRVRTTIYRSADGQRMPWDLPADHTRRFNYSILKEMMEKHFRIEKTMGISLLFGVPWMGSILAKLPHWLSDGILKSLNRIARRVPALADVIVFKGTPVSWHK